MVGGADAKPKGFTIFTPAISVVISTLSISVKNPGNLGIDGTFNPYFSYKYLWIYQEAVLPSLTASTKLAVPQISPPAKMKSWVLDYIVFELKLINPVF